MPQNTLVFETTLMRWFNMIDSCKVGKCFNRKYGHKYLQHFTDWKTFTLVLCALCTIQTYWLSILNSIGTIMHCVSQRDSIAADICLIKPIFSLLVSLVLTHNDLLVMFTLVHDINGLKLYVWSLVNKRDCFCEVLI